MHPAPSVILFTTLSGIGFGLLAFLGLGLPVVTGWLAFAFFAVAYLLAVVPIAAVVIATPSLGIVGIWLGLLVWMTLRASVNHRRVTTVLSGKHHAWSDALSAS